MIAVDSSVLIDLLEGENETAAEAAIDVLRDALRSGPVVVCDVVLAEVCAALKNGSEVLQDIEEAGIRHLPTEARAALRAGEMQRRYRQREGQREQLHRRAPVEMVEQELRHQRKHKPAGGNAGQGDAHGPPARGRKPA